MRSGLRPPRALLPALPGDLGFFFEMFANDDLPYCEANSRAVANRQKSVCYHALGVDWQIPSAPDRAECFNEPKSRFANLEPDAAQRVDAILQQSGIAPLKGPPTAAEAGSDGQGRRGRRGRPAALFD